MSEGEEIKRRRSTQEVQRLGQNSGPAACGPASFVGSTDWRMERCSEASGESGQAQARKEQSRGWSQ
jgi:hypothetical protein